MVSEEETVTNVSAVLITNPFRFSRRGLVFLSLICYHFYTMWKHWVNAFLGVLIIFLPYLGLTDGFKSTLMVVFGIIITVFSFWSASEKRNGAY